MFKIKKKKSIIKIIIVFLLIAVVSFFLREFITNYFVRLNMKTVEAPGKDSKVLIVAPHNDDEVLGAAELIKKVIQNGGQVKVVLVSNGDGFKQAIQFNYFNLHPKPNDFESFGYMRQKESIRALSSLGLSENNITFLGYPDGAISYLFNTYWDKDNSYISEYTQSNKSPYNNSYTAGTLYTGENLENDISKIISEYKPTHIIYPHPNDNHPDHWAVNAFVKYALTSINYKPEKEWLYLVHRGDWPTPMKQERNMYLVPPSKLINTDTKWYALDITDDEITEKSNAIHSYKSQIKILGPLLTAFERKNELYGEYNNVKLSQSNTEETKIEPNSLNQVITDPLQDALNLEIIKSADISGVYAERSNKGELTIIGEMDGDIEEYISYNFNLIFFKNDKITRLNIEVRDNKIYAKQISKQSIIDIKEVTTSTKGKFVYITIPKSTIGDFNHVFINLNTSIEDKMMDKTSWRMMDK